jgi:NAD-dependent dihydropyrimidine dehydrogenase PreA subunit|tara:strand:+ start:824 stop:1033 length:210 start_codon:yes stop_codon:yes gene_type:complete
MGFKLGTRFANLKLIHEADGEIIEAHGETCHGCSATRGRCGEATEALKGDRLTTCDGELVIEMNLEGTA